VVWFDPAVLTLETPKTEGIEFEEVLRGSAEQAAAGLAKYRVWTEARAARIAAGSTPQYRVATAGGMGALDEAREIAVETITLTPAAGRPTGRKFGRLVHGILERADRIDEVERLARVCGRRHAASEAECVAAAVAARAALERVLALSGGAALQREVPLLVRLADGRLVDGRIDLMWRDGERWTLVDYKTDRRDSRRVGQLQLYALGLQRAAGGAVRVIVLEV